MPLNKLDNFLKNIEGRILYVSPSDLDASDAMSNQGNSQTTPFKTIQRALIEAARFSYVPGNNNDITEKTTILLMPGEHIVDNRPGYKVEQLPPPNDNTARIRTNSNTIVTDGITKLTLNLNTNFDLNQEDNVLYKFNSVHGGVIVPRGTSIVGLDLRKTKIRPKYVPNPTTSYEKDPASAIFRITGACYFWQFSIFDGSLTDKVYIDSSDFTDSELLVKPSFSHHKLTVFEYADGINKDATTGLTDLNMYYYKLSLAYGSATEDRNISEKFPQYKEGFVSKRPEFEIVGAFAADPIKISSITAAGSGGNTPTSNVTVKTATDHGLDKDTPIRIKGVGEVEYNISTNVSSISSTDPREFTYNLEKFDDELKVVNVDVSNATVIVETDTVNGASPYIFNISLRSVFGMNGMHADGAKATGFRSMVVAQFTGVSLQKDDRAFVKYNQTTRSYDQITIQDQIGTELATRSSSLDSSKVYHLDSDSIYRSGWETRHVKISNDSILQIVSVFAIGYGVHFEGRSGSDASITNSNSNFGQLALVSDGFKKDAFAKDDRAFVTHIIPPRAVTTPEEEIDWVALDNQNATGTRIYLFGFNSKDIKPPSLTQGFRIGAKTNDLLFVNIGGVEKSARIMMTTGGKSGVKEISIQSNNNGVFQSTSNHFLQTGEKVIIVSDDGDLPENIDEKTVFYIIYVDPDKFRLATSLTNAENGTGITAYGGTNLNVLSRVTDKDCGDVGHPVQYDDQTQNQWYITVDSTDNTILSALTGSAGRTEPSFVKRISDTRSLDEKIYKLRLAIPKEITNSKNPENGFVIQESSNTNVRKVSDFTDTSTTLTTDDYLYNRNPRFISTCTFTAPVGDIPGTVKIGLEKPHNLDVGDLITIKNITDTTNTTGEFGKGYNRETPVTKIIDGLTFEYSTGKESIPSFATNNFNDKTSDNSLQYPRYERTDLKSNVYIFRNNIISEFTNGTSDGVYQVFALNSSNNIPVEFTDSEYSQNVVDVYPQLDRDNINENPPASKTFALRSPLGQVITNDPLKSITRETTDKLLKKIGVGLEIQSYDSTTGVVSFTQDHGIAGIMTGHLNGGSGYNVSGTYYNVKVFTSPSTQNDTTWNGTLATATVSGTVVSSFEITNPGSDMLGKVGYFDNNLGGSGAKIDFDNAQALKEVNVGVSTDIVIQTTGIGVTSDSYFRIIGTNSKREVSIAKTTGDVPPQVGQYGLLVGSSSKISNTTFDVSSGITTVVTSSPHGLVAGNRFQLNDATDNNQGSFIVESKVNVSKFTFKTSSNIAVVNGYILKHGLSANDGLSGKGNENLSVRGVELFDKETAQLSSLMASNTDKVPVSLSGRVNDVNLISRFPYGSYIIIDEEIMRVKSTTLIAPTPTERQVAVIRGVFGTTVSNHDSGSLVKSIKAFPIQFNRPSIIRASGHTFEYLGYGPGNYSTALPQVQVRAITEREEFLSQSQERSGGAVVYTGMNNKGDFYIGNQKKSALTGEETSFDTPIPSVAGEDPGRLSVVFDEVTVKDRIVIEGGKSKTVLSEFDGPVTFNNEVQFKDAVKIKNETESTSSSTGALLISGGVGFAKTSHFADNAALKFGDGGDLMIVHEPNVSNPNFDANVIRSMSEGNTNRHLYLQTENKLVISNTSTNVQSAIFDIGNGVSLNYGTDQNTWTRFETIGAGATVTGTMFATNFSGSGSGLTDLNETTLKDVDKNTRVEATATGATITGHLIVDGGDPNLTSEFKQGLHIANDKFLKIGGTVAAPAFQAHHIPSTGNTFLSHIRQSGQPPGGGNLFVQSNSAVFITNSAIPQTKTSAIFNLNGGVKLNYIDANGADGQRLLTTATGVQIGTDTTDGNLNVTGDIAAFFTPSDKNLKDNISPIKKALDKVKSISGNTFDWKEESDNEGLDTGVIAQEIESLGLPGIVRTKDNGYKSVQYHKIIPLLIEAIKELSAKVDTLENK